jgi:ubiquitin-activating enzyme E1
MQVRDDEEVTEGADDDGVAATAIAAKLRELIPVVDSLTFTPVEFEKDDDTNYHIAFMTASANLRARNYKIAEASNHQVKMIAGLYSVVVASDTLLQTCCYVDAVSP